MNKNNKDQEMNLEGTRTRIGILGAGGGGTNAIANNAHKFAPFDLDFLAINTDKQALLSKASQEKGKFFKRYLIGKNLTKGLGAGANPQIGWNAAKEDREFLEQWLSDKRMIFIATGMGGGSGTGAGPYVARLAKMMGVLTVAISTLPFDFEGRERMENALIGLKTIEKYSDLSIVINNNDLFKLNGKDTAEAAFQAADKLLGDAIVTILSLLLEDAYINLDFADVKKVVQDSGAGYINIGFIRGVNDEGLESNEEKIEKGVRELLTNALVTVEMNTAKKALLSISGPEEILRMDYVRYIINKILQEVNPELDIIFGLTINNRLEDNLKMSLILTGMDKLRITDGVKTIEEMHSFKTK